MPSLDEDQRPSFQQPYSRLVWEGEPLCKWKRLKFSTSSTPPTFRYSLRLKITFFPLFKYPVQENFIFFSFKIFSLGNTQPLSRNVRQTMDNNQKFYEVLNTSTVVLQPLSVKLAVSTWHNWHNLKYYCLLKSGQMPICIIFAFSAANQDLATSENLFQNPNFQSNFSFQRKVIIPNRFCWEWFGLIVQPFKQSSCTFLLLENTHACQHLIKA